MLNSVYEAQCRCQPCRALDRRLAQAMQLQTQQTRSVGNLPVKTDKCAVHSQQHSCTHTVRPNRTCRALPPRLLLSLHRYIEQWSTYREHIPFANGFTWNARTLGTIAIWAGVFPYFIYTVRATAFALLQDTLWWPCAFLWRRMVVTHLKSPQNDDFSFGVVSMTILWHCR